MVIVIIKYVLAFVFGVSVLGKLTGKTKSTFDKAGYSSWVMYATAAAEIVFAIGLFTPYSLVANIGLLGIIAGAIVTLYRQRATPAHYALALIAAVLLLALLSLQIFKSTVV